MLNMPPHPQLLDRARELTAHLTIRPGRRSAEDAAAFAELYNANSVRKVKPAYYLWQFFSTPNPSPSLLVEDEGTPIAAYEPTPCAFWLNAILSAPCSVN